VLTDNTKKMYYLEYTDTVVAKAEHWAKRIQTEVERNKVV
jgi:hypothetical protein